jgi:hypothetical protein
MDSEAYKMNDAPMAELGAVSVQHKGVIANRPIHWEVDSRDGKYTLTLSGGTAEERKMEHKRVFNQLTHFGERFAEKLHHSAQGSLYVPKGTKRVSNTQAYGVEEGSSPFILSGTNLNDAMPPVSASISLTYCMKDGPDDVHTRQAIRGYVQDCVSGREKAL